MKSIEQYLNVRMSILRCNWDLIFESATVSLLQCILQQYHMVLLVLLQKAIPMNVRSFKLKLLLAFSGSFICFQLFTNTQI